MQHKPLQSLHLSNTKKVGGGGESGPRKRFEKEESPVIKLDLGNCEEKNRSLIKYSETVLNPAQLFEFKQQALIFKYIRAGLPVPRQLVIPIWKTVASSFGSDCGGIYKQYPSFLFNDSVVGFSTQEFDYKNMTDPEPGRCRRTDGKKWRCSKDVVPDQKYCERHMHRGRQRSRKLVEASQIASQSCKTSANDAKNSKTVSSHSPCPKSAEPFSSIPSSDIKNSESISTLFQFMTPSITNTRNDTTTTTGRVNDNRTDVMFYGTSNSKSVTIAAAATTTTTTTTATSIPSLSSAHNKSSFITTTSTDSMNDVNGSKKSIFTITIAPDTAAANTGMHTNNPITFNIPSTGTSITATETVSVAAATTTSNSNYSSIDGKHDSSNCTSIKNMINIKRKGGSSTNTGSNPSAGLGFSPNSVLPVLGCSVIELEPVRCRRTDGKKWRCSREVVPDQKYCGRHMHRGAKRRVEASKFVATTTTVSACRLSTVIVSNGADSATLNTNLSISIPAKPPVTNDEEKSPTSSSDATISDTTIAAYENANCCS
ncbi:hypothetical protein Ddye_018004 [Dipteronia dyeriana]|uniref:Growth-regulating factor n=1 Tax=Dipteronia dyeriana TaxID=168575 RepID=A0AAD9UAQ4_9ROSI|nr:hypothetical protein Ddye_018004 [Dipteronia dyeriana]